MIITKPHIFLKRLVIVTRSGKLAYDESFHLGVNIIRGRNSSGKSTIANFIFFIFGGAFNNWSTESRKCKDVFAEVDINGATITLKREIEGDGLQPMYIYWGTYENSVGDLHGWQIYPYKQRENTTSFSRVIFNALSFPEIRTDADQTITMHQILRLLYIDQDTSTQNLFRAEKFDPPLTRITIAEVLLGIYDDSLYRDRLDLRAYQKEFDQKRSQYDGIKKIYAQSGAEVSLEKIAQDITENNALLDKIDNEINVIKGEVRVKTTKKTPLKTETIQEELLPIKNAIKETKEKINNYEVDLFDSKLFIETMQRRVRELDSSLLIRKVFGELPLTHCPHCLNVLGDTRKDGECILCKQPVGEEAEKAQAKRLKQELELQIKESENLYSRKTSQLTELRSNVAIYVEKARFLQKQLDTAIEVSQSTRDERLDGLYTSKGRIEKIIEYMTQQRKAVETLNALGEEIDELYLKIKNLKQNVSSKESQQEQKRDLALSTIRKNAIFLLRHDLPRQLEFQTGQVVDVDYYKDTYALDNVNNFSASSKIYLKNSVLYSIFFSSLDLEYFRYPRFILCDNMEDKGMEKDRTQNFQNQIVATSRSIKEEHQIIFTTSMISDQLDNDASLCIGRFYDQDHKTLNID